MLFLNDFKQLVIRMLVPMLSTINIVWKTNSKMGKTARHESRKLAVKNDTNCYIKRR